MATWHKYYYNASAIVCVTARGARLIANGDECYWFAPGCFKEDGKGYFLVVSDSFTFTSMDYADGKAVSGTAKPQTFEHFDAFMAALCATPAVEPVQPADLDLTIDGDCKAFADSIADVLIEGKYAPMAHQIKASYYKATHGKCFDLSTMRTGKTGSTILAMEYLYRTNAIKKALVLAPLSCCKPVWEDAIARTLPNRTVCTLTKTKAQCQKLYNSGVWDCVVMNYEHLKILDVLMEQYNPDLIVIDECTAYANTQSRRSKHLKQFISFIEQKKGSPIMVWGLTGTPGDDPIKAFSMSKAVNPCAVKVSTVNAWRDMTMYHYGTQAWQWTNRDCAPQMIQQALSPAVRFNKEDLFNLPPVVYSARFAPLCAEAKKVYDNLRTNLMLNYDADTLTATQKSVEVNKLLQISTGSVRSDSGSVIELANKDRIDLIKEIIEETDRKTVIFCAFTASLNRLYKELTAAGYNVGKVDGSTSEAERVRIFGSFQNDKRKAGGVDVLVAHPRTVAFGVELSAADTMIFDGVPLSGDFVFGQAVERLSSLKQTSAQINIIQVYSTDLERRGFLGLQEGQASSALVAELFRDATRKELK